MPDVYIFVCHPGIGPTVTMRLDSDTPLRASELATMVGGRWRIPSDHFYLHGLAGGPWQGDDDVWTRITRLRAPSRDVAGYTLRASMRLLSCASCAQDKNAPGNKHA